MSHPIFDLTPSGDKELQKIYGKAMRELNEFFEIRWKLNIPSILIAPTREVFKKIYRQGEQTPDWVVGTGVNKRVVMVLSSEEAKHTKGRSYNKGMFYRLVKHELCHCFTDMLAGPNKPRWVAEGVSLYVAEQFDYYKKPEKFTVFLEEDNLEGIYKESIHAIKILVDNHGKQKLLDFLRLLKEKKSELAFKEVYGLPLTYKTFNNLILEVKKNQEASPASL